MDSGSRVSWDPPVDPGPDGIDGYRVWRLQDDGSWFNLGATYETAILDTTAPFQNGLIYGYRIQPFIGGYSGTLTQVIGFMGPPASPDPPPNCIILFIMTLPTPYVGFNVTCAIQTAAYYVPDPAGEIAEGLLLYGWSEFCRLIGPEEVCE